MISFRKLNQRRGGVAIGLVIALLAGAAQYCGWLGTMDHIGFDLHSRWFGSIPADTRIVLVDIDDSTIRAMGEYPWPRRHFADLVRELEALGAERILLDVLFTEPGSPRIGGASEFHDEDAALEVVGDPSEDEVIRDDDELIAALRKAHVLLPAVGHVTKEPPTAPDQSADKGPLNAVDRYLNSTPNPSLADFLDKSLPPSQRQSVTIMREELSREYRSELSRRAVRRSLHTSSSTCTALPIVRDMITPYYRFVPTAAGIGFAAYPREELGGVVRSVPVAVRSRDSIMVQIGVLAAMDSLNIAPSSLQCDNSVLRVGDGEGLRTLPVDADGEILVYWHVPPSHSADFVSSFRHIPALRLLEIAQFRRAMDDNVRRLGIRRAELVRARYEEVHESYARYAQQVRRLREIDAAITRNNAVDTALTEEQASLRQSIEAADQEALIWLARAYSEWSGVTPQDEYEQAEKQRIDRLHKWFSDGALQRETDEINVRLSQQITEKQSELRGSLTGKLCLIGYTATAVADLVTTPIHAKAPGVMVHANVMNMMLQNRFLAAFSPGGNGTLVAGAALLAALMACAANWRLSLVAMILICGGVWLLGSVLFRFQDLHIASLSAMAASAVSWSGVTWYRQSTEERAKKRFELALTQYTSPAIASAIAEEVRPDALSPKTATVTCFFSDLDGFTRLSEQLGPARTREVLNPYLELTSKILLEHGAIVNKFVGDGVFAFFNAPIRPCPDHARQACLSARHLLATCPSLSTGGTAHRGGESHRVRIGMSTGEAFVGDYGSNAKLDYTCIGDTINLGSRLEQLNKILGATVLVDAQTRTMAGNELNFRPMGRIRIHGRSVPAEVYEMLVDAAAANYALGEFEAAWMRVVSGYQACQWDICKEAIAICRRERPMDRAAALYWASVNQVMVHGLPADWDGALDIEAVVGMERSAET